MVAKITNIAAVGLLSLMIATTSASDTSPLIPPAATMRVSVGPEQQKVFFEALQVFAGSHQLKYDRNYIPFSVRPFTNITLSDQVGNVVSVTNVHDDDVFDASFFVEMKPPELEKFKDDFVKSMSDALGKDKVNAAGNIQ